MYIYMYIYIYVSGVYTQALFDHTSAEGASMPRLLLKRKLQGCGPSMFARSGAGVPWFHREIDANRTF